MMMGLTLVTDTVVVQVPVLPPLSVAVALTELVVEGAADVLDRLVEAITAEMDRYIDETSITIQSPTGEFAAFEVGISGM